LIGKSKIANETIIYLAIGALPGRRDLLNATYPGAIGPMIKPILPAALAVRSDPGDFVNNAVKENAKRTARRLTAASTFIAGFASVGKLTIVAAIYDLETGVVTYLD